MKNLKTELLWLKQRWRQGGRGRTPLYLASLLPINPETLRGSGEHFITTSTIQRSFLAPLLPFCSSNSIHELLTCHRDWGSSVHRRSWEGFSPWRGLRRLERRPTHQKGCGSDSPSGTSLGRRAQKGLPGWLPPTHADCARAWPAIQIRARRGIQAGNLWWAGRWSTTDLRQPGQEVPQC